MRFENLSTFKKEALRVGRKISRKVLPVGMAIAFASGINPPTIVVNTSVLTEFGCSGGIDNYAEMRIVSEGLTPHDEVILRITNEGRRLAGSKVDVSQEGIVDLTPGIISSYLDTIRGQRLKIEILKKDPETSIEALRRNYEAIFNKAPGSIIAESTVTVPNLICLNPNL